MDVMKVLIADDEAIVRRALKRAMQTVTTDIVEAEDGEQALEVWKSSNPDLVFLDVLMPGLTGPQVLQELEQIDAKVILMSAYTGEYNMDKARSLGADLFIAKPFEDIFLIIEQAKELMGE